MWASKAHVLPITPSGNVITQEQSCYSCSYASFAHGDLLVLARSGTVGGLSQPRRDTVDPKAIDNNQLPLLPRATEQFNRKTIADSNQLSNLFLIFLVFSSNR